MITILVQDDGERRIEVLSERPGKATIEEYFHTGHGLAYQRGLADVDIDDLISALVALRDTGRAA